MRLLSSSESEPETTAGQTAQTVTQSAREVVDQTLSMALFVGLLLAVALLLAVRSAGLAAFPIPDGLLVALALVALTVGAASDSSVVPDR